MFKECASRWRLRQSTPSLPLLLIYHRIGFENGDAGGRGGGGGGDGCRLQYAGGRTVGGIVQHRHPGQVHHAVEL